jgi:single-strand DNA-binding protein
MNLAPVTISGNITADPELTVLANGTPKCSFSVAVNYVWYDDNREKQERVSFINVTAWRYQAENLARVAQKGIGVIVTGRLEQRSYEDKEGNKRSAVEIVAEDIGILTRSIESLERKRVTGGDGAPSARPQSQPVARKPRQTATVGATDEPF